MTGLILCRIISLMIGVIIVAILLPCAHSWYMINFSLPKRLTEFGKEHNDFNIEEYEPFRKILLHLKKGNDHVLGDKIIKDVIDEFDTVHKRLAIVNRTHEFMASAFKHYARKCLNSDNLYNKYTDLLKFMIKDAEVLSEIINLQNEHFEWLKSQPNDVEFCVLNY